MAPPHDILTKKMVVPPAMVRGEDVVTNSKWRCGDGDYLSLCTGVSCRIWFHTCGSWFLPKFLFKEGSFALMNMASLMFLIVPCDSLWTMLKQSGLTGCPMELVCWWMGDEA